MATDIRRAELQRQRIPRDVQRSARLPRLGPQRRKTSRATGMTVTHLVKTSSRPGERLIRLPQFSGHSITRRHVGLHRLGNRPDTSLHATELCFGLTGRLGRARSRSAQGEQEGDG